jgi:hypothetical protein
MNTFVPLASTIRDCYFWKQTDRSAVLPLNVRILFSVAMGQEQRLLNGVSFQPLYDADVL